MDKIFIDTDIVIDYTHDKNKLLKNLLTDQKLNKVELFINPVVLAEFFTDQNLNEKKNMEQAYEFISIFNILDINVKIGILAGKYLRENKINSLGDALIAASCLIHDFQLVTRNRKHFSKVPQLQFYSPDV